MEFIKEMEEMRKEYYMNDGINWIARHLEGEAAIWWKLTRHEVDTFQEFQEAFYSKVLESDDSRGGTGPPRVRKI